MKNPVELYIFRIIVIYSQRASQIHCAFLRKFPRIIHRKSSKTSRYPRPAISKHRSFASVLWIHTHFCNRQIIVSIQLNFRRIIILSQIGFRNQSVCCAPTRHIHVNQIFRTSCIIHIVLDCIKIYFCIYHSYQSFFEQLLIRSRSNQCSRKPQIHWQSRITHIFCHIKNRV
ncbi:hypothetical protein D3C87_858290 [compost metagenome]